MDIIYSLTDTHIHTASTTSPHHTMSYHMYSYLTHTHTIAETRNTTRILHLILWGFFLVWVFVFCSTECAAERGTSIPTARLDYLRQLPSPFFLLVLRKTMLARVAVRSLAASTRRFGAVRTIVTKKYTKEHEVLAYDSETRVGTMSISDYAQASLGQVAFVELPTVGADVKQEEQIGAVESTKAASDIFAPISGKIVAVNDELSSNPGLINKDPEGAGWLCKIEATDSAERELDALLTQEEYSAHCESEGGH